MSLASIREKNKKTRKSFLDSKIENTLPPEVAKEIKNDVFYGFIKPINDTTLNNLYRS